MIRLCKLYMCTRSAVPSDLYCKAHLNETRRARDRRRALRLHSQAFRDAEARWAREYRARKAAQS